MQELLIQRFKDTDTFTGTPTWAWQFKPSIPLVGKNYKPGKGLLIYASAENLSWLNNKHLKPEQELDLKRFQTEAVWNRYRACYEEKGKTPFFPNVGIQPVTDGGLFTAGLFITSKVGLQQRANPHSFLETIAVTNWCKFSIKSHGNKDYLRDIKKLTASLPFVVGELALLQPAVVLIPQAVWRHPVLKAAMRGASPWSRFLPAMQFNARVVNYHLRDHESAATRLCKLSEDTQLALWMNQLERINPKNAWRYIAMLSDLLKKPPADE